jgi:hypothetical protein
MFLFRSPLAKRSFATWAEADLFRTAFPMIFGRKPSMAALSHEEINYQSDSFDCWILQVTPTLPNTNLGEIKFFQEYKR